MEVISIGVGTVSVCGSSQFRIDAVAQLSPVTLVDQVSFQLHADAGE